MVSSHWHQAGKWHWAKLVLAIQPNANCVLLDQIVHNAEAAFDWPLSKPLLILANKQVEIE